MNVSLVVTRVHFLQARTRIDLSTGRDTDLSITCQRRKMSRCTGTNRAKRTHVGMGQNEFPQSVVEGITVYTLASREYQVGR